MNSEESDFCNVDIVQERNNFKYHILDAKPN